MPRENDLDIIPPLKRAVFRHIRWLTRGAVLVVVGVVIVHRFYPPLIEWLGKIIGIENAILTTSIAILIISVIMLERMISIEEFQLRPLYQVYTTREQAYNELFAFLIDRNIKITRLDLFQFSGDTAVGFLTEVAKRWPQARIRLLLIHPDVANNFDTDTAVNHRARIIRTVSQIAMLQEDHVGFKVDIGYYRTQPGLAAIIGDRFVNVGWYRCYTDRARPGIVRLRGHNLPAITAVDEEAATLQSFTKSHFEEVWATKEPDMQSNA
jgi:hypothetical protein